MLVAKALAAAAAGFSTAATTIATVFAAALKIISPPLDAVYYPPPHELNATAVAARAQIVAALPRSPLSSAPSQSRSLPHVFLT